jgi:DNA repair protein RadC
MTTVRLYRVALRRVRDLRFSEPIVRPLAAVATAKRLLKDVDREALVVMYLDAHNDLLGAEITSVGSLNTTRTTPREIFKGAILAGALGIIIAHPHPSGSLEPSDEDVAFTRAIAKAGELIGIELFDSIIISRGGHTSLRERGLF